MKSKFCIAVVLVLTCIGCNVGNAPEPMSENDLKGAVDKLPPKEQIDYINASPMPAAMKAQRIKEIEDRTGYKAPATGAPTPGAPTTGQ
jgi:hypothetical protein